MARVDSTFSTLQRLENAEPTEFLTPNASLAIAARNAARELFAYSATLLKNKLQDKYTGLNELHADGFDAEQIWLQINLQQSPAISLLKKQLNKATKKVDSEEVFFKVPNAENKEEESDQDGSHGIDADKATEDEEGGEDSSDEEGEDHEGDEEEDDDDQEGESEGDEREKKVKKLSFEDKFLSIEDMEKFLEQAEAEEWDGVKRIPELYESGELLDDDDDEEDEEGDDDSEDEQDLEDEEGFGSKADEASEIRYDDFFGPVGGKTASKGPAGRRATGPDDREDDFDDVDEEEDKEEDEEEKMEEVAPLLPSEKEPAVDESKLSSYERKRMKIERQARELEEANLNPQSWSMQGEVAANRRPKNSALEVEMDFEHAARPPPVITEEVTASLEDLIRQRIVEQRFDDVERKKPPMNATPKERIELDDSKSQQGLAEIYEAEYAQAAGLAPAAATSSDAIKQEAAILFKDLCSKLDALSHFHFAPKPVIEDMNVKVDVPAIAMEEVAPMAVAEASLLAPEEIFAGGGEGLGGVRGSAKGTVMAEKEMSREDKKKRHRKVKRKRKAQLQSQPSAKKDESVAPGGSKKSIVQATVSNENINFTKSSQVFAKIQDSRDDKSKFGDKRRAAKDANGSKSAASLKL